MVYLVLILQDYISSLSRELLHGCCDWSLSVTSCTITSQGGLNVKLHRPSVFKKVLTSALEEGDNYGKDLSRKHYDSTVTIGIVNGHLLPRERRGIDGDMSLSQLRGLLLTEHLSSLLESAGLVNGITCIMIFIIMLA